MKRVLVLLLTLIMVLMSLTACGSKENKEASNNPSVTKPADSNNPNPGKKFKIGIVQHVDHPSLNLIRETIETELKAQGLGDKVEVVFQNANGDLTMLPTIFQNMISDGIDILVPIATPTAQAALAATTTVPIVFSAVSDPVAAGLVTAFDQTTANITGVSNSIPIEDIFALASELTPKAKTFGFVYNTSEVNSVSGITRAKKYCDENGIAYKEATITSTADLQEATSSLIGKVDAFFTPNDNMVASAMPTYVQIASQAKLPIYVGADSMVNDGGLATVGIDYTILGKQTADMIGRIVNGETIDKNHVEQVSKYAKMINTKTAEQLSITIPDSLKDQFVIMGK